MEGHRVTISVASKPHIVAEYKETYFCAEADIQKVKYLYHKYTHENHPDVQSAEDSHTLHTNSEYPSVQRLVSIEPVDEIPEADLPLRLI